ncbi:histone deacetylase 4-like [Ostrinia nubilalis]|uniref:histone deacetylase 4-like n=1 Tax=Ostrinia nubilalis TaxID=29057 RepID=UPI0030822699
MRSLEGGYDLPAVCDCAEACVRALLGERLPPPPLAELARAPHPAAQRALKATHAVHEHHWPTLKRYSSLIGISALEASPALVPGSAERDAADTAAAMATLSMTSMAQPRAEPMEQDDK